MKNYWTISNKVIR